MAFCSDVDVILDYADFLIEERRDIDTAEALLRRAVSLTSTMIAFIFSKFCLLPSARV